MSYGDIADRGSVPQRVGKPNKSMLPKKRRKRRSSGFLARHNAKGKK